MVIEFWMENHLVSDIWLQHYKSAMPTFFYKGWHIKLGLHLVLVTQRAVYYYYWARKIELVTPNMIFSVVTIMVFKFS